MICGIEVVDQVAKLGKGVSRWNFWWYKRWSDLQPSYNEKEIGEVCSALDS